MRAAAGLARTIGLCIAAIALATSSACAWPDKPIRFVVPFAPGGPVDVVARVVAAPVAEKLATSIVIENRPGAGGNIGIGSVARAAPDGSTFLVVSGGFAVNPSLYDKVPYDPIGDFAPVMEIATSANLFVSAASSGIKSMKDLVDTAKSNPGKLSYAGPGIGTQSHFAFELFKLRAGIDIAHVSHNGAAPAVQSMLSGAVPIGIVGLAPSQEHIKAGTLHALAAASEKRLPQVPEMPTMIELGYKDFVIDVTLSMFAPAHTPTAIVERMAKEAGEALQRQDVRQKLGGGGFDITALPPAALKEKTAREVQFWKEAVSLTGIRMR